MLTPFYHQDFPLESSKNQAALTAIYQLTTEPFFYFRPNPEADIWLMTMK
jgi:hypothetical protein